MGAPTPSMPQNPTNQPMQQQQSGGKGGGKGMSGSGMATPPVSQANNFDQNAINANPQGFNNFRQQALTQESAHPGSTMFGNQQPMPQASGGKGIAGTAPNPNAFTPDNGNMTVSATSGQAQTGQPNPYANTTGSWDNQSNQQPQAQMGGKGKGA